MNYTLVKDELGYYRCDPIPSQDELDRIYSEEYYTAEKPKLIERQEDDIDWWNTMYDDRITVMSEIYRKSCRKIWPLMLDVGCGGGFFLRRAFANPILQWMCVGIEPNLKALNYAKNKSIFSGGSIFYESSLENLKEHKFWGIHLSEVLEHIPNPLQMLKDCYDRLSVGGALCVVVPNEKMVMLEDNYAICVYPHVFQPPHHINYFDFDSLTALMEMAGFTIYEKSAMYPMETFLTMGLDYTKSESIGRLCHHHRMAFDLSMKPEQRRKFYREMAENKLGRECVIYGVKK